MTHPWESWSDARAYDGTATILQPQALPLYDGVSAHEMLALYMEPTAIAAEQAVKATWKDRLGGDFASGWADALANGVIPGTATAKSDLKLRTPARDSAPAPASGGALSVLFRPDPSLWDGRFANNPWLQELPRPLTKLVWDNPLLIAPALAARMRLRERRSRAALDRCGEHRRSGLDHAGPGARLRHRMARLRPPRRRGGRRWQRVRLLSADRPRRGGGAAQGAAGGRNSPAPCITICCWRRRRRSCGTARWPNTPPTRASPPTSGPSRIIYRWKPPGPAAWAMSVDLNACIGCNACVVACSGRKQYRRWSASSRCFASARCSGCASIATYEGSADAPESYFQPMLCMHCEQAPCEIVCPVGATVHDSEGLNVMVYNRCVGTRFCSNNCPYKVRRFNYFAYALRAAPPAGIAATRT